jgi:hypothetical protein
LVKHSLQALLLFFQHHLARALLLQPLLLGQEGAPEAHALVLEELQLLREELALLVFLYLLIDALVHLVCPLQLAGHAVHNIDEGYQKLLLLGLAVV